MNSGEGCLLENIDYTKWQKQRFDNMSSDEFQKAAIAYVEANLFSKKV